jgi:hypothetical protein
MAGHLLNADAQADGGCEKAVRRAGKFGRVGISAEPRTAKQVLAKYAVSDRASSRGNPNGGVHEIGKVRVRGETWPVDPGVREALDQLGADLRGEIQAMGTDLRGEIRSSAAETRVYVGGRIETTRVYVDERFEAHTASLIHELRESESRTRRYFDVAGESLRGDIRGVAELVALSKEDSKRRDNEQARRLAPLSGTR